MQKLHESSATLLTHRNISTHVTRPIWRYRVGYSGGCVFEQDACCWELGWGSWGCASTTCVVLGRSNNACMYLVYRSTCRWCSAVSMHTYHFVIWWRVWDQWMESVIDGSKLCDTVSVSSLRSWYCAMLFQHTPSMIFCSGWGPSEGRRLTICNSIYIYI